MYFLMGILMYICLCGRYFLNPFNGCSFYDLRFVWILGCTSVLSNITLLLDPRKRRKEMLKTCVIHCSRRNEKFQAEGSLLTFTSVKSHLTWSSTRTIRVHSQKWCLIERSLLILQVVQQLLGKWMWVTSVTGAKNLIWILIVLSSAWTFVVNGLQVRGRSHKELCFLRSILFLN
jgi:hypothetical protein